MIKGSFQVKRNKVDSGISITAAEVTKAMKNENSSYLEEVNNIIDNYIQEEDEVEEEVEEVSPIREVQISNTYVEFKESAEISKARAMYISDETKTLKSISKLLNIPLNVLERTCLDQKWSLFRVNPDMLTFSQDLLNSVYEDINFYQLAKETAMKMVQDEQFKSPKDLKTIIEGYSIASLRTKELYLLRENSGSLGIAQGVTYLEEEDDGE